MGLLRRLLGHVLLGDLPRRGAVLGAGDQPRARLRQLARDRRPPADHGAAIDFHTYSELVLWPYGYTTANTAPG